jgi:hypothetical protein
MKMVMARMEPRMVFHGRYDRSGHAGTAQPGGRLSVTGNPTFRWYSASGGRYYQLAYGTENDPAAAVYNSDWITATMWKCGAWT